MNRFNQCIIRVYLPVFLLGMAMSCTNSEHCHEFESNLNEHDSLAISYQNQGIKDIMNNDTQSAIIHFKKAIQCDSTYYLPHSNLAQLYIEKGEYEEALQEMQKVVSLQPTLAEGHGGLAMLYDYLNRSKDARLSYEKGIDRYTQQLECEKDDEQVNIIRMNRAFLYVLSGEESIGNEELNQLRKEFEDQPHFQFMIDDFLSTDKKTYLNKMYNYSS
jgi:Tfp pilus assembly protein PilF